MTFSSCNKSVDTESNIPNNTPANTIEVSIDTSRYSWRAAGTSITNSGITTITVEGADTTDNGSGVGFTLTNITKHGTYDIRLFTPSGTAPIGVTMSSENMTYGLTSYSSSTPQGNFTIQFISPDSLKATFNATLAKRSGSVNASASMTLKGTLNVRFQRQ
jgi:hypothetical protein